MARPERNNVDYFPFLCEDGKKMFYLEETYGNDGFATFVKILRELAKTDYHYLNLSNNTTVMFLSAKCKVSKDVLIAIINDLVELGKFDRVLWIENKIIWCNDFIKSIQDAYNKRNNKCINYEGLIELLISLGVRKPIKKTPKGDGNSQSKVEYTIVEESKIEIPTLEEFKKYALENDSSLNEKSIELKYKAWAENDWKNGNNKKIKNWKTTLLNTIPYLTNKQTKSHIQHDTDF